MKTKVRSRCFETNSSSIHSICIPRDTAYKIPDYVSFSLNQYGWGPDVETNLGNYLYTALAQLGMYDRIEKLKEILYAHGVIDVEFEEIPADKWTFWIDHVEDFEPVIEKLFADEEYMMHFLFTPGAAVYMTNDNDYDEDIIEKIEEAQEHEEEIL